MRSRLNIINPFRVALSAASALSLASSQRYSQSIDPAQPERISERVVKLDKLTKAEKKRERKQRQRARLAERQ